MAESAHPSTCVCYDCLPGGTREHRVRPWPAKASDCGHPTEDAIGVLLVDQEIIRRSSTRLRIPTQGGGYIEQCRLCGTIVRQEGPPVLEEPTA